MTHCVRCSRSGWPRSVKPVGRRQGAEAGLSRRVAVAVGRQRRTGPGSVRRLPPPPRPPDSQTGRPAPGVAGPSPERPVNRGGVEPRGNFVFGPNRVCSTTNRPPGNFVVLSQWLDLVAGCHLLCIRPRLRCSTNTVSRRCGTRRRPATRRRVRRTCARSRSGPRLSRSSGPAPRSPLSSASTSARPRVPRPLCGGR